MSQKDFKPKEIVIKVNKRYYCGDGYITQDIKDAEAHGYGKGKSQAFSFEHDLTSINYEELPLADSFDLMLGKGKYSDGDSLSYICNGKVVFDHPFENVSYFIKERGERFVGTMEKPYSYLDQGVNFMIFDVENYMVIIYCDDIDSPYAEAFKVKKQEYYTALNKIHRQIGVEEVSM